MCPHLCSVAKGNLLWFRGVVPGLPGDTWPSLGAQRRLPGRASWWRCYLSRLDFTISRSLSQKEALDRGFPNSIRSME